MNVYLAGKITKNGWRSHIYPGIRNHSDNNTDHWGESYNKKMVVDGFEYVGPYFLADDHGMFHGEMTHGRGLGKEDNDNLPDLEWEIERRDTVISKCFREIGECDIVFVWVDETDIFGTITEIGYAKALGKKVYVGVDEELEDSKFVRDSWFAFHSVDEFMFFTDVEQAWEVLMEEDRREMERVKEEQRREMEEQKSVSATGPQKQFIKDLCKKNGSRLKVGMEELSKKEAMLIIGHFKGGGYDEIVSDYIEELPEDEREALEYVTPQLEAGDVIGVVLERYGRSEGFTFDADDHRKYVKKHKARENGDWTSVVKGRLRFYSKAWVDFLCLEVAKEKGWM